MLAHVPLGPILSPQLDAASAKEPLQRSAWEQGSVAAASAFAHPRSSYSLIQVGVGAALGIVAGSAVHSLPLYLQVIVGVAVAVAVYWLVPTVWAVVAALRASSRQRDSARAYAGQLEGHADAYVFWARRRELAEDFRREALEDSRRLFDGGGLMGTVDDEETRWRSIVAHLRTQLADHGATDDILAVLDVQMEALSRNDDGYGSDQVKRIASSMAATCQNLWSEVRRADPAPTRPHRPADPS